MRAALIQSESADVPVKLRSWLLLVLWFSIPTLLWSLIFRSFALCLDPLFIWVVSRLLSRRIALLVRAAWACAFVVAVLSVWYVMPWAYGFYFFEALPYSPPSVLFSCSAAAACLSWFVAYGDIERFPRLPARYLWVAGGAVVAFKFAIIIAAGRSADVNQRLRSQLITVGRIAVEQWPIARRSPAIVGTPGLTFDSFIREQSALPDKVVLMVVESWAERPAELKLIQQEMRGDRLRIVKSGYTAYRGATLSGEIRELCSRYVASIDTSINGWQSECAPQLIGKRGYDVVGLHGFNKDFYSRQTFWRAFGLTQGVFVDALPSLEHCPGPFQGVCDDNLIREGVGRLFADDAKRFLYLLTLSSHEPMLKSATDRPPGRLFEGLPAVHGTQVVTRRAISSLITELERANRNQCVLAYVVGDHQPPSAASSGLFPADKVPFIAFEYNCR
jgi:hypothetical protein